MEKAIFCTTTTCCRAGNCRVSSRNTVFDESTHEARHLTLWNGECNFFIPVQQHETTEEILDHLHEEAIEQIKILNG